MFFLGRPLQKAQTLIAHWDGHILAKCHPILVLVKILVILLGFPCVRKCFLYLCLFLSFFKRNSLEDLLSDCLSIVIKLTLWSLVLLNFCGSE